MMYSNKFVVVVKVGGKILREMDGVVYIPFGSEYEISFKNLHTTRALVHLTIDDEDVLDGSGLVVSPNQTSSVEGFLKGNNVSHKFKFIEKTQQISEYRGDRISDGLIRVVFSFEKPKISYFNQNNPGCWGAGCFSKKISYNHYDNTTLRGSSDVFGAASNDLIGCSNDAVYSAQACIGNLDSVTTKSAVSDQGITVKGSESNQNFSTTSLGAMEMTEHSMVIQLKGEIGQTPVAQPVLVRTKVKCDTCGQVSLSGNKFCGKCGTSLVI